MEILKGVKKEQLFALGQQSVRGQPAGKNVLPLIVYLWQNNYDFQLI